MVNARQQAERYEGWLEAAESGDFSEVEFSEYEGNGLPSPVMQLSVYEEDGELEVDDEVVKAYMVQTGDIDYRSLQKLAGDADVNPVGKETQELLDVVTEEYGGREQVVDELMSREDDLGYTDFRSTIQESLVDEGIHGRQRVRDMLSDFKQHSSYENPEPEQGGEKDMGYDNGDIHQGQKDRRFEIGRIGDEALELRDNLNGVSNEMGEVLSELKEVDDELQAMRNLFGRVVDHDAEAYGQVADMISNASETLSYEVKASEHIRSDYEGTDQQMHLSRLEHVQSSSEYITRNLWPDADEF